MAAIKTFLATMTFFDVYLAAMILMGTFCCWICWNMYELMKKDSEVK